MFITGASSDIGLEICRQFLHNNWKVLAHFRTPRQELQQIYEEHSSKVTLVQLDFSDTINLEQNLSEIKPLFETVDSFIGCAASLEPESYGQLTQKSIAKHFHINVIPNILITQHLVPGMIKRKWGRIIYLSSVGIKFGGGVSSYSYALSKHCLEFLPAAVKGWAEENVLANTVRVGVTDTEIHKKDRLKNMHDRIQLIPAKRMATPKEIAIFAFFLGSELNTFISNQILPITGGE